MKKIAIFAMVLCLTMVITGCGKKKASVEEEIDGLRPYYKMSDGTWKCEDLYYKYRLEISGRMSNAVKDSTFVYLSNLEELSFAQAWKASGLSSNLNDYFPIEDAVLVELR
ncbi:MAG: immunogenic protein [Clostridia bacterium]|nr:immunogenic protein [Clostridia bacterium]